MIISNTGSSPGRPARSLRRNWSWHSIRISLLLSVLLGIFLGSTKDLMASPIGLMERFALAENRAAFLSELIPGSDDYYFYHCLHYQNTSELDRAEAILKDWSAVRKGRQTSLMRSMLDRQRLLTYDNAPDQTVRYLVDRLGIQTSHGAPGRKGTRRFESEVAKELLAANRLVVDSLRSNKRLSPFGMQLASEMYRRGETPAGISLKDFLKRVDGAYLRQLDQLVIAELRSRPQREQRFGDLNAHRYLTLEEIERVGQAVTSVRDDNDYVNARIRMLRPGEDASLAQQPSVRLEYLQRLEAYTRTLTPAYNSLKAAAAYRLLEANLQTGKWDRELFLRYLVLPRQSPVVNPLLLRQSNRVSLTADYEKIAVLPPIGNEQPLVDTYLEHFLRDARDTSDFARFIAPDYLRRVFARTKLMAGTQGEQTYYNMLTPQERRELRDQVQLTFAPNNPRFFAADAPAELLVDVKNVDQLVVRVYEMNSLAYYRTNDKLLDTDVELDGLIATYEQTLKYDRPAVVRHRERIAIEPAQGRGVWIVDLVGKGLRTRAIIRKGDLETVQTRTGRGLGFTVVDENRQPVAGAKLYVGNQEFIANENGQILLPMVNKPLTRRAIVSDGKIAKRLLFVQPGESYSLKAAFFVDRTLLQSGRQATCLVRPRLTLGDTPVDPGMVEEGQLHVTATDLDGIQVSQTFGDLKLTQDDELAIEFRVPARTAKLTFELTGHVVGLSDRRKREVAASDSVELAGIRRTNQTADAFLTHDGKQYVIETRGRSGEIIPAATIRCQFNMELGDLQPTTTLQSDERGLVRLGSLEGVRHVQYGIAGGTQHRTDLRNDRQTWPISIHLAAGETLRLPVLDRDNVEAFRLIELRSDQIQSDQSGRLGLRDGFLLTSKMPAGDYALIDRMTARRTLVSVVDGPRLGGVLAGAIRHREQNFVAPVTIQDTVFNADGSLTIRLGGQTDLARVHLIASRYFGSQHPLDALDLGIPGLQGRELSLDRSGYISDLRLGDEYEYVLRRQYAAKYPGVMLAQPGVILNPWETETTSNSSQTVADGEAPIASSAPRAPRMRADGSRESARQSKTIGSDYDFLVDAGTLASGLIPDDDGTITLPPELIDGLPLLRLVVTGPLTVLQKTLTRESDPTKTQDLRLASTLDVEKPYTFDRGVVLVGPDKPLDLDTLGSAQLQVYGNVGSLFELYQTLVGDSRFGEFAVLRNWNAFSTEQKLKYYSELACHELHLFLWVHDRAFFDGVIRPYLANKKEKQFIDHWLLGDSVEDYTQLWRYQQLSAAERALLAMAVPAMRDTVRRDLGDYVESLERDFARQRALVESAIAFGGLAAPAEAADKVMLMESMDMMMDGALIQEPKAESRAQAGRMMKSRQLSAGAEVSRLGRLGGRVGSFAGGMGGGGGGNFAFYQALDATKQWAESHFDRVRVVGGAPADQLIPINAFWRDLANTDWERGDGGVPSIAVSEALLQSADNRHAALISLAFCGLPMESGQIGLPSRPETLYKPEHSVALVTKRLMSLEKGDEPSPILIGQLFRPSDANEKDPSSLSDPSQFETGQAYVGTIVLSNPTAKEQTVELFWQIPAGSLPLAGSQVIDSMTLKLAPFAVSSAKYQFYFPATGKFAHYPATVSQNGTLMARGNEKTFEVVEQLDDPGVTWQAIARDGDAATIQKYLADANVHEIDWDLILHRLRDRDVYEVVVDTLESARLPRADIWAYGFHHRDVKAMRHFVSLRDDLIGSVGPVLRSSLLDVNSIERGDYEHLEYAPLVRARIHRLGDEDEILNDKFLSQYQGFVKRLGYQPSVSNEDRLPLAYYLLIQNRIEEAMAAFDQIDSETVSTKLQYEYMHGYLRLHRGEYEAALAIAKRYASHPVPRWRLRFETMATQVIQRFELMDVGQLASVQDGKKAIDEGPVSTKAADLAIADRERANRDGSAAMPEVIARVEDDTVRLDHRNADEIELNFYGVDLELLFSKAPFARADLQRIAMVKPTKADVVTAESKTGTTRFVVPESLRSKTLLVEAVAGASRSTTLYYGGDLTTYVSEAFGQLQTTDSKTRRPVAGAYVKVYARYSDGDVRFYKDGYTDGRGRFDYESVSAGEAAGAVRYAILVLSESQGATLHDVAPPQR